MGPRALGLLSAGVATLALLPAVAIGGEQTSKQPAVTVKAEGNVVTGGLAFDPKSVSVQVGDVVAWTNTDNAVPHTATEDHGLWNLTGTYGSPGPYQGFGPGETRSRAFEAGTAHYYCQVHPTQMHGVVAVPVTLKAHHRRTPDKRVVWWVSAKWASQAPAPGQGFEVRYKVGHHPFTTLFSDTRHQGGRIDVKRGPPVTVEARLRSTTDASKATGWSPRATVTPA